MYLTLSQFFSTGRVIFLLKVCANSLESWLTRKVMIDSIETTDFAQYAKNVQGIFINLNIFYIDVVLQKLKDTEFSKQFISNGLVFIWTDKTRICEIIDLMEEKKFNYVENIVFSVFDIEKLSGLISDLSKKSVGRKKTLEGIFKIQNDPATPKSFTWKDVTNFLLTTPFTLPPNDSVENYLLKFPSEFIATNKRTLLVFRRVS